MKLKISRQELNECISKALNKVLNEDYDMYGFDTDDVDANDEYLRQLLSGDKNASKAAKAAQTDISADAMPDEEPEIEDPVKDVEDDEEVSAPVNKQMPNLTKNEIYKMPTNELEELIKSYSSGGTVGRRINHELTVRNGIKNDYEEWQKDKQLNKSKYVPIYGYKIDDEGNVVPSLSRW